MKSHLISGLVIVILAAGNLWQFLHSRDLVFRSAHLRNEVIAVKQEAAKASEELNATQKREAILKADNAAAEQKIQRLVAAAQQNAAPDAEPAQAESKDGGPKKGGSLMQRWMDMLKNPETRKAMRAQQMFGMRMMYSDLVKQLHLDSAKADELYNILLDQQMESLEIAADAMSGKTDPAKEKEIRDRAEKRMEELLGAEGKTKASEFQRTMGERFLVNQFSQKLGSTDLKMSDQQSEGLLQIMIDESKRTPAPGRFKNNPAEQANLLGSEQAFADYQKHQREYYDAVLKRSTTILSAAQMDELKGFMNQMLEMQKASAAMMKTMGDSAGK